MTAASIGRLRGKLMATASRTELSGGSVVCTF